MDISIKLVLQELLRRIWIIILCAILGLAVAFTYTKCFVAPVYTTSMKVSALTNLMDDESVSSVGSFINMMTLAERRVEAYIELMKTSSFYERVATTSGTGYSAGAVKSMLEFKQVENMGLYYVYITGIDPVAIKAVGDAVAQEMWPYIESFQSHSTITVIEPPVLPTTPINQTMNQNQNTGAQNQSGSGSSNRSNRVVVPQAKGALNQMKYEIASELGINLKQGYNGDLPSRQAGYIGGYMTKRLIEQAERAMSNQG